MLGGTVITVHGAGFDAAGAGDSASCSFNALRDDGIDTVEAGAATSMVCNTSTTPITLTPHHAPSLLTLTTHHSPLNFHPDPHQVCNTSTTVVVNVQSGQRFSGAGARFLFLSLNGQAMRSISKW